jgi:hypothetical protein
MIRPCILSDILYFAIVLLRIFKVAVPVELADAQLAVVYSGMQQLILDVLMV